MFYVKVVFRVSLILFFMLICQNCSKATNFETVPDRALTPFEEPEVVVERPPIEEPSEPKPIIVDFSDNEDGDPVIPGGGLIGQVYYLLNDSGSEELPDSVTDKNGNRIAFPDGVDGVDVIIDNGIELPADILLTSVFIPTSSFLTGFEDSAGNSIKDVLGNTLIEAFAIDVKGTLELSQEFDPGNYEMALLSDDGAILSADINGDGNYNQEIVNNDGSHSTKMGCSSTTISLAYGDKLPLRLKYYQGPRAHISLTLLMRRLGPGESPGQDPDCGYDDNYDWFDFEESPTYRPEYVSSRFGDLTKRGWEVPTTAMFKN